MHKDARFLKRQNFSQTGSVVQTEQQKLNATCDISESDFINLSLELEAQLTEIKTQNEELAQAMETSEAAKRKYSALFENNPCGLFLLSEKGVIIELNSAGAAMMGLPKASVINQDFSSFIAKEGRKEFMNFVKLLFDKHLNSNIEVKLITDDASSVYIRIDASADEISGECLLTVSKVNTQKGFDHPLLTSENKYRKLHDSIMDGFAHVNMSGKITEYNEIFRSWLGYTDTEIKNLSYLDITPECWHKKEEEIRVEQLMKQGFSEVYEKEYRRKDGTIFPVELRSILMRDEKGENTGMWAIVRDITHRKQAENKIKNSEEKYRTLIEFAPDAFFQGDAYGNIIIANNRAVEISGYSKNELLAMNMSDLIPDFILEEKPLRYDLLKQGNVIKTERAIRRKTGELVLVEMKSKAMPDNTYQCFARDITKRKLAEEIIRNSEERYRELADSITDDFFSMDKDLRFTYCNKSFEKSSGIELKDCIGKSIYDVYPDVAGSLREMVYLDVLQTKKPGNCIDEFLVKGEKRYFEIKTYPSQKGLVVFLYDINHRMQIEKELELLKSIIESSGASVAVSDADGKLVYVNPAYEKLFGRSFEEASLLSYTDYHPAETLKIFNNEMLPALNQGKPWEGEIAVFHKNGQKIPIWSHAGSIQDANGQNVVLFSIMDDVSAQKKAEKDKLHLELLKGEESERLRIAHDLHNHIGHIIIAIKIHIERVIASATNDQNREQLERLLDKVIFALKEVRLVSSALAGRFAAPLRLNQQISTFLIDLEVTSNIPIVQKIDPLPDEIPAPLMRTVVGILEEALTNVMKHSNAKQVYIHIFIKKNRLFINLRDNGKGLDNSLVHKGSGLNFLKEEAEQIGGEISIKSVPGKFCMLKFNAPISTD